MMQTSWYTPQPDLIRDHLHLRLDGPLEPIWELGMAHCERTPMLERIYHPNMGILYVCIDPKMRPRLNLLQFSLGQSQVHQRPLLLPELMFGNVLIHPFRLADIPVQPYRGEIGALRLRSTTLERGPLRYYRMVDTPTAEIAQQLAPLFSVYCFAAKTTQLT